MKTECNSQMKLDMEEVHEGFFWPAGASPARTALMLDSRDEASWRRFLKL